MWATCFHLRWTFSWVSFHWFVNGRISQLSSEGWHNWRKKRSTLYEFAKVTLETLLYALEWRWRHWCVFSLSLLEDWMRINFNAFRVSVTGLSISSPLPSPTPTLKYLDPHTLGGKTTSFQKVGCLAQEFGTFFRYAVSYNRTQSDQRSRHTLSSHEEVFFLVFVFPAQKGSELSSIGLLLVWLLRHRTSSNVLVGQTQNRFFLTLKYILLQQIWTAGYQVQIWIQPNVEIHMHHWPQSI